MNIINSPQQHLLDQLQKQVKDENQSNSPKGIGIMDLGSNLDCWHCIAIEDEEPLGGRHCTSRKRTIQTLGGTAA